MQRFGASLTTFAAVLLLAGCSSDPAAPVPAGFTLNASAPGQEGDLAGTEAVFGPGFFGGSQSTNGFFVALGDVVTAPAWLPVIAVQVQVYGGALTGPTPGTYTVRATPTPLAGVLVAGTDIGYYADSGTIQVRENGGGQLTGTMDVWLSKNRVSPNDGPEPLRLKGSFVADTAIAPAVMRRGAT